MCRWCIQNMCVPDAWRTKRYLITPKLRACSMVNCWWIDNSCYVAGSGPDGFWDGELVEPIGSEIASAAVLLGTITMSKSLLPWVPMCCVLLLVLYVRRLFFLTVDMICPKYVRNGTCPGRTGTQRCKKLVDRGFASFKDVNNYPSYYGGNPSPVPFSDN